MDEPDSSHCVDHVVAEAERVEVEGACDVRREDDETDSRGAGSDVEVGEEGHDELASQVPASHKVLLDASRRIQNNDQIHDVVLTRCKEWFVRLINCLRNLKNSVDVHMYIYRYVVTLELYFTEKRSMIKST